MRSNNNNKISPKLHIQRRQACSFLAFIATSYLCNTVFNKKVLCENSELSQLFSLLSTIGKELASCILPFRNVRKLRQSCRTMQDISVGALFHGYKHKGLRVVICSLLYFKINGDFTPHFQIPEPGQCRKHSQI